MKYLVINANVESETSSIDVVILELNERVEKLLKSHLHHAYSAISNFYPQDNPQDFYSIDLWSKLGEKYLEFSNWDATHQQIIDVVENQTYAVIETDNIGMFGEFEEPPRMDCNLLRVKSYGFMFLGIEKYSNDRYWTETIDYVSLVGAMDKPTMLVDEESGTCREEIIEVANEMSFDINEAHIIYVLRHFDEQANNDPSGYWRLWVEQCLHESGATQRKKPINQSSN